MATLAAKYLKVAKEAALAACVSCETMHVEHDQPYLAIIETAARKSFVTVTIRIFFALSRIGIEAAIARAALRLKSHAITIVLSSNGRGCSFSGRIKVGFPDLNMIASAYH